MWNPKGRHTVDNVETLTDWLRDRARVVTVPIARQLHGLGVHPNTVTLFGLLLAVMVALVLAEGRLRLGGGLLLAVSAVDALDGALARFTEVTNPFGAFLDSTLDRLSEGALLFGLLVALVSAGRTLEIYLLFASLLGAVMVSYTRARAEGVGYACKVGLLTRVPRVILIGVGLLLGWALPMLIALALLSWFTVLQRMLYVYRESQQQSLEREA